MNVIHVRRTGTILQPDRTRVLIRPFNITNEQRAVNICARVLSLSEEEVRVQLEQVLAEFGERHLQIRELLRSRYERMKKYLITNKRISEPRSLLIGAYFTHEYALEAAALFNPSITPHPDQTEIPKGALRFILSLRATGEGHISSITFRSGTVDANQNITLSGATRYLTEPRQIPNANYEKKLFERKLYELHLTSPFSRRVMEELGNTFNLEDLRKKLNVILRQVRATDPESELVARGMILLA